MELQPVVGQSLLIIEASRWHSVGLLWMSDKPDAETSGWQHATQGTDIDAPLREANPQSQQASGRRSTP
jgi:hypothetical protein